MKVLVVEDNDDVRQSIRKLLMLAGHEPYLAVDYHSAIEICRIVKPEFVLIDIHLPGHDGYQLAEELRDKCGLQGVQVWALSGFADDPERRRKSGIVGHIQKPLSFAHIQTLIGVVK